MKSLCINITEDTESWQLAQAEFSKVGLTVERFPAVVEDNRVLAFNKSVYGCMKKAVLFTPKHGVDGWAGSTTYQDLLLFEDDVAFDAQEGTLRHWPLLPFNLPSNFMTLHLGGNIIGTDNYRLMDVHGKPEFYNSHLCRIFAAWQTHAVLYSAECVQYILDNFKYVTDDYKTEGVQIFDDWLTRNVMNQGRSYVLNPMIAYQRPRKSEIWNVHADYTGAHKQGNEYLKQLR